MTYHIFQKINILFKHFFAVVLGQDLELLNVTIFRRDNVSEDVSLSSLDLPLASGYVLEEEFGSVSGFILDGHFYGTVFVKAYIGTA